MKKKLLSLMMAVAMIATLAAPAFANGNNNNAGNGTSTQTYNGTTALPTVTVTVEGSGNALAFNPYGMSISTKIFPSTGSGGSVVSGDSTDQIVVPALYIKNQTVAPMKFGVKATATVQGNTVLSAKPCTGKETTLNAFVMAEFHQDNDLVVPATIWTADWSTTAKITETINEKFYPQIIPTADGKTAAALYSIDQATTASGGAVTPNYLIAKISGNLAGNPTGGWTSADTLKLVLEFTFTPGVANTVTLSPSGGITLYDAGEGHSANYVSGATVRLNGPADKTPVVKDANDANVSVSAGPKAGLYYFVMPATPVTVTAGA